ncbi:MAG: apolipoprotein N-acyltransferase [Sedimentisphaerales bacterium]|nr:apolipoprotein N-acyltransferase [Sedimentisphaerales bacterium]
MDTSKAKGLLTSTILFVCSALALTVIQVPYGISFLAWVAWVPFLVACFSSSRTRWLLWASYPIALTHWLSNVYWVGYVTMPAYILFCFYLALYWPLLIITIRFCVERMNMPCPWREQKGVFLQRRWPVPLFLAMAVLLVGAEAWQGILLTGFNWRFLAHSQYKHLALIQIADLTGQLGISFLIALVNGLVAELIVKGRRIGWSKMLRPGNGVKVLFVGSLIAASILYGNRRIKQTDQFVTDGPKVGSVQSNIPSQIKELDEAAEPILQDLIQRSNQCFEAGALLVAWPETIVLASLNPGYVQYCRPDTQPRLFNAMLGRHTEENHGYVLTGAHGADLVFEDDEPVITDRYNTAFLYRPDGTQDPQRYDKIHLVPFGEYIPFKDTVPPLYNLVMSLSPYEYDYHLTAGTEHTVFEIDQSGQTYRFGVLICYEDTDEQITRRTVLGRSGRKRVDFLVNVSNDGWYVRYRPPAGPSIDPNAITLPDGYRLNEGTIVPSQELAQRTVITVFRAVENRVSILRSVNTGISCLIDSVGRIHDDFAAGDLPKEAMKRQGIGGWFVDTIPVDHRITAFSRTGPILKHIAAVLFALVALPAVFMERKRRMKSKILWATFILILLAVTVGCNLMDEQVIPSGTSPEPFSSQANALRDDALSLLRNALTNENSYIRTNAIEVVAATDRHELMPIVTNLLRDEIAPVRFAAALAVGDTTYEAGQFAAQELLNDVDERVRLGAAYALVKLGKTSYEDRIRTALRNRDHTAQANAAMLLGKLGHRKDIVLLYDVLNSTQANSQVRIQAVESIARLGDDRVYRDKLWPLLISIYPDDRVMGIRGMGALGTELARNALLTMLQDDVQEVRLAAAEQLGRLGDRSGEQEVLDYLAQMPTTTEQTLVANSLATHAIGSIGTDRLKPYLPRLLNDSSPTIQLAAAQSALFLSPHPQRNR